MSVNVKISSVTLAERAALVAPAKQLTSQELEEFLWFLRLNLVTSLFSLDLDKATTG